MGLWQPLLAATPKNDKHWQKVQAHMSQHQGGLIGQTKVDGVRVICREGIRRRKLDLVLSTHIQAEFGRPELEGLDGEMTYGDIYNPDLYRISNSNMKAGGSKDMDFWVWDDFTNPHHGYADRYDSAAERVAKLAAAGMRIHILPNERYEDVGVARAAGSAEEERGAEGLMLKSPTGFYKTGRSTVIEGLVIKVKSWEDQEGVITGMKELFSNQNEATEDNRGYTKRSSHKENQVPMGTMGALEIKYLDPEWGGRSGKCGSGFTAEQRRWFWENKDRLIAEGTTITFKFQRIGSFEKPRFPIFRRIYLG